MKISELTEAQFRRYFESRLSENRMRKSGRDHVGLCCFHDDRNPSLSVNYDKGVWKCHAGCGSGGILDFEQKFSNCDKDTALQRIAEIVGESHLNFGQQPEAVYQYTDAFGKDLFQVVRYPGKRFAQRRRDEKGGWIYKTQGMKMSLYNLPDVAQSTTVLIVEGEKCADYVKKALEAKPPKLAVTTSPRGAGKWQEEFGAFMAGKQVLIVADKDETGRKHAETVAASCYKWSTNVKVMQLPEDMPEKSGCDDFIAKHTIQEFMALSRSLPSWKPPERESSLFMTVSQFRERSVDRIDWHVEGVIQKGANGMIIGRPKGGKSFAVIDLAVALASGQKWLDFYVPKRVKTALVSREDYYGLTQWREKKLSDARHLSAPDLDGHLYINAKGLKPKILLDYPEDVAALIGDLKRYGTEFLILDVMRVLHGADENDNTDMQKVIDTLNMIQGETGASICLIHHENKKDDATLTERARGATAIAGWAEFICGIRVMEEVDWTREFSCELKAGAPPDKFYWRIIDTADGAFELARVQWEPPRRNGRKKDAEASTEGTPF